jgi:hypothetical protein
LYLRVMDQLAGVPGERSCKLCFLFSTVAAKEGRRRRGRPLICRNHATSHDGSIAIGVFRLRSLEHNSLIGRFGRQLDGGEADPVRMFVQLRFQCAFGRTIVGSYFLTGMTVSFIYIILATDTVCLSFPDTVEKIADDFGDTLMTD